MTTNLPIMPIALLAAVDHAEGCTASEYIISLDIEIDDETETRIIRFRNEKED